MCESMVDMKSVTADIKREKKIEDRKKTEETRGQKNIMSASATQGGHNNNFPKMQVLSDSRMLLTNGKV